MTAAGVSIMIPVMISLNGMSFSRSPSFTSSMICHISSISSSESISRELAKHVDFLSIGTNDLTQYTLAMDRQNPLLKDKYNDHHPAILRMVRMVVDAAHQEGRKVGICGEIAADTALTKKFLEMGVDFLSVVPACVLPVRKAIRETDLGGDKVSAVK